MNKLWGGVPGGRGGRGHKGRFLPLNQLVVLSVARAMVYLVSPPHQPIQLLDCKQYLTQINPSNIFYNR